MMPDDGSGISQHDKDGIEAQQPESRDNENAHGAGSIKYDSRKP